MKKVIVFFIAVTFLFFGIASAETQKWSEYKKLDEIRKAYSINYAEVSDQELSVILNLKMKQVDEDCSSPLAVLVDEQYQYCQQAVYPVLKTTIVSIKLGEKFVSPKPVTDEQLEKEILKMWLTLGIKAVSKWLGVNISPITISIDLAKLSIGIAKIKKAQKENVASWYIGQMMLEENDNEAWNYTKEIFKDVPTYHYLLRYKEKEDEMHNYVKFTFINYKKYQNRNDILAAGKNLIIKAKQQLTQQPTPQPHQPFVSPQVNMYPSSGTVGTTFTDTGKGFSPNRTATVYGRRPDGSVWQITTVQTDSSGAYSRQWTAQTPGNNFAWWAVDNATGKKSNEIVYNVTAAPQTQLSAAANPLFSWKASATWSGDFNGPRDSKGRRWFDHDFDDFNWSTITLPDNDSFYSHNPMDRFYRASFDLFNTGIIKLSFSSDDGILIYVNGRFLGHWGGQWRMSGCVNNPHGKCIENINVQPIEVPSNLVINGKNVIAVRVSNGGYNSYFDMRVEVTQGKLYNATDKESNEVVYNVTAAPQTQLFAAANPQIQVSISPSGPWRSSASGQQGVTFYIRGSGFSPNASVQYHVRKPDGTEYPPSDFTDKVDGVGNFYHSYTCHCGNQIGTYVIWVIDKSTGKSTNTISEVVMTNPSCR
ncbi:MAG: hypothetical protein AB1632_14575 [Nitrospirota bacterium]